MKHFQIIYIFLFIAAFSAQSAERIKLSGTSYEMGQQWGSKHKQTIVALKSQFNAMAVLFLKDNFETIKKKALKISKYMSKDDLDEIRGIADSIKSPYEEILTFNLFYTLCVTNIGCRQFVSWGDRSEDGNLIHARNLDWVDYPGSPMKKFNTIVNFKGVNHIEYLSLTWPGFTSVLTGTNKKGITIAFNQLTQKGDTSYIAEPTFYTVKPCIENCFHSGRSC